LAGMYLNIVPRFDQSPESSTTTSNATTTEELETASILVNYLLVCSYGAVYSDFNFLVQNTLMICP
jgi:hypothetical protein